VNPTIAKYLAEIGRRGGEVTSLAEWFVVTSLFGM